MKLKLLFSYLIISLLLINFSSFGKDLRIKAQKASIDDKNLLFSLEDNISLELDEIIILTSKAIIKFNNTYEPLTLKVPEKIKIYNKKQQSTMIANSGDYNFITKKFNLNGDVEYRDSTSNQKDEK